MYRYVVYACKSGIVQYYPTYDFLVIVSWGHVIYIPHKSEIKIQNAYKNISKSAGRNYNLNEPDTILQEFEKVIQREVHPTSGELTMGEVINKISEETNTAIIYVSHRKEAHINPNYVYELAPYKTGSTGKIIKDVNFRS